MPVGQDRFRRLALACLGAEQGAHHGHPDFRVGGRVFATLHADGATGMVRVPPGVQRALIAGAAFRPANGAWGRAGCTLVKLAQVDDAALQDAMLAAWQFASAATTRRKAKK